MSISIGFVTKFYYDCFFYFGLIKGLNTIRIFAGGEGALCNKSLSG